MSKRKGLSVEEKKQRMLQLLYEKKEVFQLKDLEKIAPKEKGIIAQSVKDVVQALVDDGFVDSDKVGTSVYFWAFPSKASNIRKRKIDELSQQVGDSRKKLKTLEKKLSESKVGKEDSEARTKQLEELGKHTTKNTLLVDEIKKYSACDPEVLESLKVQASVAKDASNRWTDNIFATKSWCKKKFFFEDSVLNKQFGIPEDLDYIE